MTDTEPSSALSIDQQLVLRRAATRLSTEFDGIFGTETIERFLYSSYDQFARQLGRDFVLKCVRGGT